MALTEVTSKGIKDGDIGTADIAADAITGAKLADNACDSEHYTDGSIDTAHIGDDQVTEAKLAANSVTSGQIAANAIVTAAIQDNQVTLAKMAGGTDGQIITYDANGDPVAVGPGTDGQVLTSTGAGSPPAFEDLPASGVTVSNNSNNRVVTGDGSNLNAEASLTFDGDHLTQTIDADGEGFNQTASGNHYIKNEIDANRSAAGNSILSTIAKWNGKEVAGIKFTAGGDTTNKDDGRIIFETSSANNITERARIDTEGKLGISTTGPDHMLSVVAANSATPRIGITNPDNAENFNISTYHDSNGIYTLLGANAKLNASGNGAVDDSNHKAAAIELDARNHGAIFFLTTAAGSTPSSRMKIDSSGYITTPNRPHFFANGTPDITNNPGGGSGYDNTICDFATVHTNTGSHYNNTNGRFTAPIAGVYHFSATIWTGNSDSASDVWYAMLCKNGSANSFAGAHHTRDYNTLHTSVTVTLAANDIITFTYNGTKRSSTPRNYFSGYLLG